MFLALLEKSTSNMLYQEVPLHTRFQPNKDTEIIHESTEISPLVISKK